MKVILLTDIPKVGNKYDVKDFKEGYAQNVLLSKGLAVLATKAELAKLEDRKKQIARKIEEENKIFTDLISSVSGKSIIIKAKANDKGHLFKSVGPRDIVLSIKETFGIDVEEDSIVVDHIKTVGTHSVFIKKGNRKGECQVVIEAIK